MFLRLEMNYNEDSVEFKMSSIYWHDSQLANTLALDLYVARIFTMDNDSMGNTNKYPRKMYSLSYFFFYLLASPFLTFSVLIMNFPVQIISKRYAFYTSKIRFCSSVEQGWVAEGSKQVKSDCRWHWTLNRRGIVMIKTLITILKN